MRWQTGREEGAQNISQAGRQGRPFFAKVSPKEPHSCQQDEPATARLPKFPGAREFPRSAYPIKTVSLPKTPFTLKSLHLQTHDVQSSQGYADSISLSLRLFPSSRCSASRNSCSTPSTLSPATFEPWHKLHLHWTDRVLWLWLSRLWNNWR